MMTALRQDVLRLFRACLRSARKCPEWEQREMMKTYVRIKFRDERRTRDETRIRRMLADGWEELAQMEYYHSVYRAKQQEQQQQLQTTTETCEPRSDAPRGAFRNSLCASCGAAYHPRSAKFCSECGAKRE